MQSADIDESNDTIFTVEDGKEALGPAQVLQVSHLGQPILNFGGGTIHHATGIAVNSNNHKVYVTSDSPTRISTSSSATRLRSSSPTPTLCRPLIRAEPPPSCARNDPAGGGTTTDCRFDWGPKGKYEFGTLPCKVGGSETNTISSPTEVTDGVSSLTLGNQYDYRLVTRNANGHWSFGADQLLEGSTPPTSTPLLVEKINTDAGNFHLTVNLTAARPSGVSKSARKTARWAAVKWSKAAKGRSRRD